MNTEDKNRYVTLLEGFRRDEVSRAALFFGVATAIALAAVWSYLAGLYSSAPGFFAIGAIIFAGMSVGCGFRAVECLLAARELTRDIETAREEGAQ